MPSQHDPRFRKVAAAVAASLTLAAVTAFGVAPLSEAELPPLETVYESVDFTPLVAQGPDRFVQAERVRRGETVASLLERLGAADAQFLRFAAHDPVARRLLQLVPGRQVTAEIDASGRVHLLQYRYGSLLIGDEENATRLTIRREGETLRAVDEPVPLERRVEFAATRIDSSLFAATDAAGIPDTIASKIADIFDGEIDFRRDLRPGAQLRVAYETVREADGFDQPLGTRVLAVEFVNDGERHHAIWYDRGADSGGGAFFGIDGRSLRRTFLRNPIEFSRVSSGFSDGRHHPLHGDVRAHRGVDFAAPPGTQVRASGDGVVQFVGRQRGYGKVVILRHHDEISTLYAHLRGFASGLSVGDEVEQGEVIGYVGSTGWATGPHLHYEFMIAGEHVDPLAVTVPEPDPLSPLEREQFFAHARQVAAQMEQFDPLRVAANFE